MVKTGGGERLIPWSLGTVTEERWLFPKEKCEKNLVGVESTQLESVFRRNRFKKYPPKYPPLHSITTLTNISGGSIGGARKMRLEGPKTSLETAPKVWRSQGLDPALNIDVLLFRVTEAASNVYSRVFTGRYLYVR